jgi:hypothetical protein
MVYAMNYKMRFAEQLLCGLGLTFLISSILLSTEDSAYAVLFFELGGLLLGIGIGTAAARSIE